MAFYYDENLARRFYQEFWDAIRDVEPIQEVERHTRPTAYIDHPPPHRPSSLILPLKIGIKPSPITPEEIKEPIKKPKKKKNTSSSTTTSSHSSHRKGKPTNSPQINPGGVVPDTASSEHSSGSSSDSAPDSDPDDEDHNDNNHPPNQENHNNLEHQEQNDSPEQRPPPIPQPKTYGHRPISTYQNYRPHRPTTPFGRGTVSPLRPRPVREYWSTIPPSTVIGLRGSESVIIVPQSPQQVHNEEPQPGPSGLQSRQRADTQPPQHPQHPPKSVKSVKSVKSTKTTKTNKTRMDPAVAQVLSSDSSFFQDQEFDRLSQFYQEGRHLSQEIQDVSDRLEQDFQNIEEEIENILSNQDNE